MSFNELLKEKAIENKSIVSFGLDPVIERIPLKEKSIEETITKFYFQILEAMQAENIFPGIFKANYAFFAQYGFEGLKALSNIINKIHELKQLIIFDGKRNDIEKTALAYAKECFDFWKADAVTISPFFGFDGIKPFSERKEKGVYVLCRTSNVSAEEIQNLKVNNKELYLIVAEKILSWNSSKNLGAVVGATTLRELKTIASIFSIHQIPLLIPGVGAQGGTAKEVKEILTKTNSIIEIQRINSSSALNYAFEKNNESDFAGASIKALKELNNEINFKC
jgi:orotidine-5'-phosphate decarboxylase